MSKKPYFEWERKTKKEEKKAFKDLVERAKEFRKKFKKRVFLVNKELRGKSGSG